jgi:hypothetical protein
MYPQTHALASLFKHLGLAHDEVAIARFIEQHSPLQERGKNAARTRQERGKLAEAPCWDNAQAAFLREEIGADADCAEGVDQLNLMRRG